MLDWSEPKALITSRGPRTVQSASPTEEFWAAWRNNKEELKQQGYSVRKVDGEWEVSLWKEIVDEEAIDESRALTSTMEIPAPPGLEYFGYQKAGIEFAYDKDALIADDPGLGKAQVHGSKVYTPEGPVNIEDIEPGDVVIGSDGLPTVVSGVFPQGLSDVYRVTFNDGAHLDVTGDHLWEVEGQFSGVREVKTTLEIQDIMENSSPVGPMLSDVTYPKYYIPTTRPVFFAEQKITQSPYELGVQLATGEKSGGIPNEYKYNSIDVRRELIRAMEDYAPLTSRGGMCVPSKELAVDVMEILRSLGALPKTDQSGAASRFGSKCFVIHDLFRRRRIESIEKLPRQELATCISVEAEDSLYVAEHFIVTHNTIQTAGVVNMNTDIETVLVICPSSLKINWKRELDKWLVQKYKIEIATPKEYPEDADIVIINYELLKKYEDLIKTREWDLMVADEAHALKNTSAQRTKIVLGTRGKPGIKRKQTLLLTGTPIMNRPIELFTLLKALDPERWSNKWKFGYRYCDAKQTPWGVDFSGASNLEELNQILRSTVMVRRSKEEALPDLPPVSHQIIEVPSTAALRKLVKSEKEAWKSHQETLEELRAAVEVAKVADNEEEYQAAVENLREGMGAGFSEMAAIRQELAVKKIPITLEHLKEIEQKVIVFFHHREVGETLHEVLGDESVLLIGGMKEEDKQRAVDEFQNNPKIKYFLGSIMASGVGLTLTAASWVVFHEIDFRPAMLEQAWSRAQRIGQNNNVLVQYLLVEESLDVSIARKVVEKQSVITRTLDDVISEDDFVDTTEHVYSPPPSKQKPEEIREYSAEEKADLLAKLKILASYDGDRAAARNNMGFSRVDTRIGHSLASQTSLSNKQAALAEKLVTKYRRQLSVD